MLLFNKLPDTCAQAFPHPTLKFSHSLPLGSSGLAAKVLYELPLRGVHSFWRPPARLMIR